MILTTQASAYIKATINRSLRNAGQPELSDGEWRQLEEQGYVDRCASYRMTPEQLTRVVQAWRQAVAEALIGARDKQDATRRLYGDRLARARAEALARIVPMLVARDELVRQWRETFLPGGLLRPDEVPAWLKAHDQDAGRETVTVRLLARPAELAELVPAIQHVLKQLARGEAPDPHPSIRVEREREYWPVPGTYDYVTAPTGHPSALGTLRQLSRRIADQFGIAQQAAVMLILTGIVPPQAFASVQIGYTWKLPFSAFSRFELTVNARISPAQVARALAHYRRRVLGQAKIRAQGKHALELAVFCLEQRSDGQERRTWREMMEQWNRQAGRRRRYKDWRVFRLEAVNAVRRLLGNAEAALSYAPFANSSRSGSPRTRS